MGLEFVVDPVIEFGEDEALVTFVNLTGFEFEPGEAECVPDCLILVNIHVLALRSAEENQYSFLKASLTYEPAIANAV